jgi:hypothetical protein
MAGFFVHAFEGVRGGDCLVAGNPSLEIGAKIPVTY